jgi:hypothetical protein
MAKSEQEEYPFGPYQKELDITVRRIKEGWNKPVYLEEGCENNAGSTWSHDCGVCPYCLSQVSAVSLLRALVRKIWGR